MPWEHLFSSSYYDDVTINLLTAYDECKTRGRERNHRERADKSQMEVNCKAEFLSSK